MRRAWLCLLLLACDGEVAPLPDASVAPDAGGETRREAQLPALGACPDGWAEVDVDGVTVCDPTPGGPTPGGPAPCPEGEARFVGSASCAPIGGACPSGDFADELPADAIHVRPGGSGDGSAGAPFGTIAQGISAWRAGRTIALAKGTYDEAVRLPVGATLRGACARETRLTLSSSFAGQSVIALEGGAVSDLTVAETDAAGVLVRRGEVTLERVVVDRATTFGVIVGGGRLTARELVVRGIAPGGDGSGGFGLIVDDAAAGLERAVLEENTLAGAIVTAGATLELTDVAARDATGARLGAGFISQDGGTISGRRVEVTRSTGAGLLSNAGGGYALEDVVVRDVTGAPMGWALSALGEVSLTRAWLSGAQGTGVQVGEGGRIALTDVVVDGVREHPTMNGFGQGLGVSQRGTLVVERVFVRDTLAGAVSVIGQDTLGDARLEGRDLTLRDVRDEGVAGVGLYVDVLGEVELEGLTVERTTHGGVVVGGGSAVSLTDVRVEDTTPDVEDGLWGRAVEVRDSRLTLTRARLARQHEVGVIVSGGEAALEDVEIHATRERGCAATTCGDAPGGTGLGVYRGASVSLRGFVIDDAALCGVQIAEGGSLDLSDGEIRAASIGACVQVDGYDVERLTDDVRFVDTGTSIQTTSHYVPEASDPLP